MNQLGLSPRELECLRQKMELRYYSKSIIYKRKAVNKLIDTILEAESHPDDYDEEYIQIKKLEAEVIAKQLLGEEEV